MIWQKTRDEVLVVLGSKVLRLYDFSFPNPAFPRVQEGGYDLIWNSQAAFMAAAHYKGMPSSLSGMNGGTFPPSGFTSSASK